MMFHSRYLVLFSLLIAPGLLVGCSHDDHEGDKSQSDLHGGGAGGGGVGVGGQAGGPVPPQGAGDDGYGYMIQPDCQESGEIKQCIYQVILPGQPFASIKQEGLYGPVTYAWHGNIPRLSPSDLKSSAQKEIHDHAGDAEHSEAKLNAEKDKTEKSSDDAETKLSYTLEKKYNADTHVPVRKRDLVIFRGTGSWGQLELLDDGYGMFPVGKKCVATTPAITDSVDDFGVRIGLVASDGKEIFHLNETTVKEIKNDGRLYFGLNIPEPAGDDFKANNCAEIQVFEFIVKHCEHIRTGETVSCSL